MVPLSLSCHLGCCLLRLPPATGRMWSQLTLVCEDSTQLPSLLCYRLRVQRHSVHILLQAPQRALTPGQQAHMTSHPCDCMQLSGKLPLWCLQGPWQCLT